MPEFDPLDMLILRGWETVCAAVRSAGIAALSDKQRRYRLAQLLHETAKIIHPTPDAPTPPPSQKGEDA